MPKKIIKDHQNASALAKGLNAISGISINLEMVKTNIIYFKLDHSKIDSVTLINSMLKKIIKFFELGPNWFRLVTHAGINEEDILCSFKEGGKYSLILKKEFEGYGWDYIFINGHNEKEIFKSTKKSSKS